MTLDAEHATAIVFLLAKLRKAKQKKKRQRKLWIHPSLQDRSEKGLFITL